MDDRIERALAITPESSASARTIDITTTGAKSGRPRRIEIWFYRVDGEIYLTTTPASRDWYANLRATPDFTFHLKNGVRADLAARAEPVLEPEERRRVFAAIIDDLNQPRHSDYLAQPVEPLDAWMSGSPLVRVHFDD
ncbi:nitroreductase family deazaflavin-dependent oxidoreductase [Protaetiibacter sp. SSC-01]|uniref:nitroreductase/quinone reductase family protein n=1 Tax=Protaetiibacter sp. SSC-01 TaxID=2759943 RepID=UPI001656C38D|nr:nitroreductase/quinone reductase family protein [Protaetiibacter sp. SSC-01]QNO37925.1 nitroreductase family deazaflavin-dependent oxidoreductase [Protaetiibacter sp. SSC-01]